MASSCPPGMVHVTKDSSDHLQHIATNVGVSQNIVVITGAGISTNAGIPVSFVAIDSNHSTNQGQDFRSKDGLYGRGPRNTQHLFHISALSHPTDGAALLALCDSLHRQAEDACPTKTHNFIKNLSISNKLLRNYTQNIDAIERKVGLCTDLTRGPVVRRLETTGNHSGSDKGVECVQLHGSLRNLRCLRCGKRQIYRRRKGKVSARDAKLTYCSLCHRYSRRAGLRRPEPGLLRPDIVLYGEEDPRSDTISNFIEHDLDRQVDLLLIIGTSLSVPGIRSLAKSFADVVHQHGGIVVFVNRSKPAPSIWGTTINFWVEWGCDDWVGDLEQRTSTMGSRWPSESAEMTMSLTMEACKQDFNVGRTLQVSNLASATPIHHDLFPGQNFMSMGSRDHPIDLTGD